LFGGKQRNRSLLPKGSSKNFTITFDFFPILGTGSGGAISGKSGDAVGRTAVVFIF